MNTTSKDVFHVLPANDTKPHMESEACECEPRVDQYIYGRIVVHNSYDKRELFERDERARVKQ